MRLLAEQVIRYIVAMRLLAESKTCVVCGRVFPKKSKAGFDRWRHQQYCSQECRQLGRKPREKRYCYACGSDRTYTRSSGKEDWYPNQDAENNVICSVCWYEVFLREKMLERGKRLHRFEERRIELETNARAGVCSWCHRSDMRTVIHHIFYDENHPSDHTVEICVSCHRKEHPLKRDNSGRFVKSSKK